MATLATSFLIGSSSFLGITRTTIISWMSSNFGQVQPQIAELAALERLEKSPWTYNGKNDVATLAPLLFIVQVTRTTIISRMGSNFSQIRPLTVELAALECLKNYYYSPALKKWGYTGFTMSFRHSVLPSFCHSVIPLL